MELFDTIKASDIASRTEDSFKFGHYGRKRWIQCILFLFDQGCTASQIEWVLRSKHMRWSADQVSDVDEELVDGFKNYWHEYGNNINGDIVGE